MRNLHDIIRSPVALNYWIDKQGTQLPVRELPRPHLNNIVQRYGLSYLKGELRGERKTMFEAVIQEYYRRTGRTI